MAHNPLLAALMKSTAIVPAPAIVPEKVIHDIEAPAIPIAASTAEVPKAYTATEEQAAIVDDYITTFRDQFNLNLDLTAIDIWASHYNWIGSGRDEVVNDLTIKLRDPKRTRINTPKPVAKLDAEDYDGKDDYTHYAERADDFADEMGYAKPERHPAFYGVLEGITFNPDPSQAAAIRGLAVEQYGCLIGAAGTGKTSVVRFLVNTLVNGDPEAGIEPLRIETVDIKKYHAAAKKKAVEEAHVDYADDVDEEAAKSTEGRIPSIAFVAFTGQATQVLKKNLPRTWRANAMTIHSVLGYAPEVYFNAATGKDSFRFVPTYTKHNKMPWDVIFIDEASMVSLQLWHQLLEASKPTCRFYFIGDLNQLPPTMGMGVLGFALNKLPIFELTTVHRQADEAANKIVDVAWQILKGVDTKTILNGLDNSKTNKNWRVIAHQLPADTGAAHRQIVSIVRQLSMHRLPKEVDPEESKIYEPFRDRILTAMNGFDPDSNPLHLVGQHPLNQSLAEIFSDPKSPRIIIDYKRGQHAFKVGYRVMATKNESPNVLDRVTNGLTGRITGINVNSSWTGNRRAVGFESDVKAYKDELIEKASGKRASIFEEEASTEIDFADLVAGIDSKSEPSDDRQSGPASHIVEVAYDNGATRVYRLNAEIEQLRIAYASTVHKAQGAEMPTAIIVIHHASRQMLSRELLYTAVTRASKRVILLYTDMGFRIAINTQKISGVTLKEKAKKYLQLMMTETEEGKSIYDRAGTIRVNLVHADLGE